MTRHFPQLPLQSSCEQTVWTRQHLKKNHQESTSLHAVGDSDESDPLSPWLINWDYFPFFPLKTFIAEQNLHSWFGDMSWPSPQDVGFLSFLSFFFLTSLLEYNCFTMLCWVSALQQSESAICIHISLYPLPLASPSHPPYPTPLGGHEAPSWSPCAMRLLPTSYLFYIW